MAENVRSSSRKPRDNNGAQSDNREILDPTNSSLFKPSKNSNNSISSILISSRKKSNLTSATFRGLGCTASSQVAVPAAIRSSADWETINNKKLKNKSLIKKTNKLNSNNYNSSSSSYSCVGVPDVCCAPGVALATDAAASLDCRLVSRMPARGKVDGVDSIINLAQRERPITVRRMVTPEDIHFLESGTALEMPRLRSNVYGSRHHGHVRHGCQEGLAEIVMLQRGRFDGVDRYRDLRLDVDNMSYEELVELGEKIGYVNTGLREDEIACCLRRSNIAKWDDFSSHFVSETERKCSICQEEYEAEDEMGKLDCGHLYHIDCIKQWLGQKNICPICKTAAV